MKTIVCDFDGTLCDSSHRIEWVQAKLWDEFHRRCIYDPVVMPTAKLIRCMSGAGYCILGLTGRNERWRTFTNTWLSTYGLDRHFEKIIMRGDNDYRPDIDYKLDALAKHFGSLVAARENILFALDDRDGVVQAFREAGITTHQVKQGDY